MSRARHSAIRSYLGIARRAALDKMADDVVILDLRRLCDFTDYFFVCHGSSRRQAQAISEHIEDMLREAGLRPDHVEGGPIGDWILMDYQEFVIHIFTRDKRLFYDLERLWGDAPKVRATR